MFRSAEKAATYPLGTAASDGIVRASLPPSLPGAECTADPSRLDPHAQRSAYADVMRVLLYVALGLAGASFALSFAMGPASVAERDAAGLPSAGAVGEAGRETLERALGRKGGGGARWAREKHAGGGEGYLRWAREPVRGEESDTECEWSDDK